MAGRRRRHVPVKKTARKKKKPEKRSARPSASSSAPAPKAARRPVISAGKPKSLELTSAQAAAGVPGGIINELARTRAWIILASVFVFLAALGALVLGISMAIAASALGGSSPGGVEASQFATFLIAGSYLVGFIVLVAMGANMIKFTLRINVLRRSRGEEDLEYVLIYQRGFWSLIGGSILTLTLLAIFMVILLYAGSPA